MLQSGCTGWVQLPFHPVSHRATIPHLITETCIRDIVTHSATITRGEDAVSPSETLHLHLRRRALASGSFANANLHTNGHCTPETTIQCARTDHPPGQST